MSHIAKIEMQIKSLDMLKAACERLGCQFMANQKSFKWYGQQLNKCDHAIKAPGAQYEVGVIASTKNPGQWELQWDNYSVGGLTKTLGSDAGLLKQAYAIEQTKAVAALEGHMCSEIKQDDGTVQLQIMM
jgi:hypothetical protein